MMRNPKLFKLAKRATVAFAAVGFTIGIVTGVSMVQAGLVVGGSFFLGWVIVSSAAPAYTAWASR